MLPFFEEVINVLIIGGIVQGFYLAFLLNSKHIKRSRANFILAILLIFMSFSIAHIIYAGKVITHLSAKVYAMGDPTFLLIAPMLWLYVKELTEQKTRFTWKLLLHFTPFIFIIISSLAFPATPYDDVLHFLQIYHHPMVVLFWIGVVVQFSLYLAVIHKKLRNYRVLVQQEISNTEGINASWVRFFMAVFLIITLFFLFSLFAVIHIEDRAWHKETTALIFSLSVYAMGYKGMLQKEIFYPVEKSPNRSPITIGDTERVVIDELNQYMIDHKPYLNPELTLSSLAANFGISRSQLSQLINNGIGDNFYDFINKYRVEEVKKLMEDPGMSHFNLLGMALEAGFKSKSTFNLIFKRFTGLTPTEYRKNLSKNP